MRNPVNGQILFFVDELSVLFAASSVPSVRRGGQLFSTFVQTLSRGSRTGSTSMTSFKPQPAMLLIFVLVLSVAAGLRIWHLDWGLPSVEEEAYPSKVAIGMWGFDDGKADLDPGTAGWPALSFYVQRAAQQLHYVAGRLRGQYSNPLDYYVAWMQDQTAVILVGRSTSVLCGLVVCLVALRIGREYAGRLGAVVAGSLCAISPMMVSHSQLVEPDALVTTFSALALLWSLRVARSGRVLDYAITGLWIGLGTAAKYTPALMAFSLYFVHLERRRAEGRSNRYLGLDDRRLGWAALIAFLAFCVTSPYTLANLTVLRRDFAYQALHMSSGHFGHEQQGLGYMHYLFSVLPDAIGWPALLAGFVGLALTLRSGVEQRVALWGMLPFLVVLGGLSTHFDRYVLPVILPLALGCALLLGQGRQRWPRRAGAVAATAVLLLILPIRGTANYHRVQSAPGTQELAVEWLESHMDRARETLVTERYGPDLPRDERDQLDANPAFARMSPAQQARLLNRPFYRILDIPMYALRTELTAYYYDLRHYLAYDWLVTSGAVRNRYLGDRQKFPRQAAFYDLLDELATPAWSIQPEGKVRGPALRIYRIDDELRQAVKERSEPLSVDHFRKYGGQVHAPHFLGFVQIVATHAQFRERWAAAAFYYEVLAQAGLSDPVRALGYEGAGKAHLKLRQFRTARDMFLGLEGFPERRLVALGNLGLIAEETGDLETARAYYETVIERDPSGEAGDWARRRLSAVSREGP
jgi:tetratricopeptide (TPR) repeat protein